MRYELSHLRGTPWMSNNSSLSHSLKFLTRSKVLDKSINTLDLVFRFFSSGTDTLGTGGLRVSLGRYDLRLPTTLDVPVVKIVLHPQFRCASYDNDIALLGLASIVRWTSSVRPACFPPRGPHTFPDVTVAGWGWTDENSSRGK